jgi:predicted metal-dependent phosphoesterase TrpH
MMNELRGQADLHIHSAVGDGLATVAQILDYVEQRTDLDLIAITDHDEVRGALDARDLAASRGCRFEVIVGTEITTRQGHLLAYDVERRYPMMRSLRDSIAAVHDDGGFVVVPHPLSFLTTSAGRIALRRAVDCDDPARRPDGIELFNPSLAGRVRHTRAIALNRRLGLAETGGSDAHHPRLIGTARTTFPGRTARDFRAALAARTTAAEGEFWTVGDHMHGLAEQQWRSMVLGPTQKLMRALRGTG